MDREERLRRRELYRLRKAEVTPQEREVAKIISKKRKRVGEACNVICGT